MWTTRLTVLLLLALPLAACGDDGGSASTPDDGAAIGDTAAPDDGGFTPIDTATGDTGPATDGDGGPSDADAAPSEVGPGECSGELKGFLCPCDFNAECASGWCIQVEDLVAASVCTTGCGEVACPDGWSCKEVLGGGDTNFICVQVVDIVCDPCTVNGDCGGIADLCLPIDDGSYCTRDCSDGTDACGPGTVCKDVENVVGEVTGRQCFPASGSCTCAPEINLQTDPDNCGVCGRLCTYAGGVAGCNAGECELLTCQPGFVDLDGAAGNGCEYPCTKTSDTDAPDEDGVDANCDGVDGEVARAIFVAPWGKPGGDGAMDDPVDTVPRGLAVAGTQGRDHVYVAAGSYEEQVLLPSGFSVFGGYSADGKWTRDVALHETILLVPTPDETGSIRAVVVKDVAAETTLGGLQIRAGNNPQPGGSSYAVWVRGATSQLAIVRSRLVGGNGGPGAAGKAGTKGSDGALPQDGVSTSATDCFCDEFDTYGGNGGSGAFAVCASAKGGGGKGGDSACGDDTAKSGKPSPDGASGGTPGQPGQPGAAGYEGDDGLGGFAGGVVSAAGLWQGAAGLIGKVGGDGLGGGGGGGGKGHENGLLGCAIWGGGGGGGGGGGCGGTPGSGGTSGGGSFALFLVDASPILKDVVLSHKSGGNGGNGGIGGKGGVGRPGGEGGTGHDKAGDGGAGGDGGSGGPAGHGGGGSGGIGYGLYLVGSSAPVCQGIAFEPLGTAGFGGLGGDLTGKQGAAGVAGDLNVQLPSCP